MADRSAHAVGVEEGEALWFAGGLVEVKLGAKEADGDVSVVEQRLRQGPASPLHVQPDDFETFYVLEGEATFHADGEEISAPTGTVVHVPAGTPHAFRVDSDVARILNVTTAQHEAFFRAAGEPAPSRELPPPGPPDMERIGAAAERHGVELLGPPPF